jgi:hypothetical protein
MWYLLEPPVIRGLSDPRSHFEKEPFPFKHAFVGGPLAVDKGVCEHRVLLAARIEHRGAGSTMATSEPDSRTGTEVRNIPLASIEVS